MTLERPFFIVLILVRATATPRATEATVRGVLAQAGRCHDLWRVEDPRQLPMRRSAPWSARGSSRGAVVAAGGDGTINAVAQAALNSGCPFGVLPQGTFNYFSRTHGIPSGHHRSHHELYWKASIRPVQVGLLNDRVFLVNASLGLYPSSSRSARHTSSSSAAVAW